MRFEELTWNTGLQARFGPDVHCHHFGIEAQVIELLAVGAPAGLATAAIRDLAFVRKAGERGDVNLPSAGLQ